MSLFRKDDNDEVDIKIVNQIRGLGLDIVKSQNTKNAGIVLSSAPILYTLFAKHLNFKIDNENHLNRDRILFPKKYTELLDATMYMSGFPKEDISKIDYKSNMISDNQLAISVGFSIAEEYLRNYFKSKNLDIFNYNTYVIINEDDIINGIFYEIVALGGKLKLNNLIVIYDNYGSHQENNDNTDTLEKIVDNLKILGWNTLEVANGDDINAIDKAISSAKNSDKPTFITIKTILAKHSSYENSNYFDNNLITDDEISQIKNKLELRDVSFAVSNELMEELINQVNDRNDNYFNSFDEKLESSDLSDIKLLKENDLSVSLGELINITNDDAITNYAKIVLNSIEEELFMSLSANVYDEVGNYLDGKGEFSSKNRLGKNLNVGKRESLLGFIGCGLTSSGIRNVISSNLSSLPNFLSSIKLSCENKLANIYIFLEDDLCNLDCLLSNDVEIFRPADMNEVIGVFKTIFNKKEGVSIIILSNNKISTKSATSINDTSLGGYILKEEEGIPFVNLIANGEDLDRTINLSERLSTKGIFSRIISMPSFELFDKKEDSYKNKIIDQNEKILIINKGITYNYLKYCYNLDNLINITDKTDDEIESIVEKLV